MPTSMRSRRWTPGSARGGTPTTTEGSRWRSLPPRVDELPELPVVEVGNGRIELGAQRRRRAGSGVRDGLLHRAGARDDGAHGRVLGDPGQGSLGDGNGIRNQIGE